MRPGCFTELDPDNALGLCDLGLGGPELAILSLAELCAVPGASGLRIERDLYFPPDKTIRTYAREAKHAQRITDR